MSTTYHGHEALDFTAHLLAGIGLSELEVEVQLLRLSAIFAAGITFCHPDVPANEAEAAATRMVRYLRDRLAELPG